MFDSHISKIAISILLAAVPAIIWLYIFLKKRKEPMSAVLLTFVAGMVSVAPIIVYKLSWKYFPELNVFNYLDKFDHNILGFTGLVVLPLSVLLSFLLVGMIEEYMKHLAVKTVDDNKFKDIDDAIEYSIIAALGFAFVENIMYFFYIWQYQGIDTLYMSFIFRSIFSTFAHVLFSGIYGYYYGIAHFSEPIYQEELRQNRHPFIKLFHKLMNMKSETLFKDEKITQGLTYAIVLHAIFNVVLEMNLTFLIVPYLIIGYILLTYLFTKKKNHIKYGKVIGRVKE